MNDLVEFLTGKEAIIVYLAVILSSCLCLIIYFVEKHNQKLRKRHNTRELNKLVEEIKEEMPPQKEIIHENPILQVIEKKESSLQEMLDAVTPPKIIEEKTEVVEAEKPLETKLILEPIDIVEEGSKNSSSSEKLEYTTIEPDSKTAQLELQKLTEELKKQESIENIELTSYEEQQEENAIISLDEWLKKSKSMYQENEITQYKDEGNEPISLEELENKLGKKAANYKESFALENIISEEEIRQEEEIRKQEEMRQQEASRKFQNSPIISPVFGIEKSYTPQYEDIALENTASYEKLDAEVKKTNEFLMTLKDLQEKLD